MHLGRMTPSDCVVFYYYYFLFVDCGDQNIVSISTSKQFAEECRAGLCWSMVQILSKRPATVLYRLRSQCRREI